MTDARRTSIFIHSLHMPLARLTSDVPSRRCRLCGHNVWRAPVVDFRPTSEDLVVIPLTGDWFLSDVSGMLSPHSCTGGLDR